MITITHSPAEGTLIEGFRKGDGVYEVLKGLGHNWRWFPSIRQIGIGQSRDKAAQAWKIERAADALRAAGHEVEISIDNEDSRSFAEAEQERYDRAEGRAEYHAERAKISESRAAGHWEADHAILDVIPMGQPILVGHHSEGRHRRDLARAESHMRRGLEEVGKRDHHENRAQAAATYQQGRESIPTTLRRIAKLEAEQRRLERARDGIANQRNRVYQSEIKPAEGEYRARLERRLAAIADELTHWRKHVETAQATTGVKVWSPRDFAKGDYAQFLGSWYEVVRVNAKSLSIPAMINDGHIITKATARCTWTDTIPYDKVRGRKTGAEIADVLAEADRRIAAQAASDD